MKFIHNDTFQVLEESPPTILIGQNARVYGVKVGEYDRGSFANALTLLFWRIAIICSNVDMTQSRAPSEELLERCFLILR